MADQIHSPRRITLLIVAPLLTLIVAVGLSGSGRPAVSQPAARPNIVFVLVDDMDAELLDHLDGLRTDLLVQGTSFSNFFLNVSLCCPSRTSILRGQYGHNTTILTNLPPSGGFERVYELGLERSTIATWLQDGGYRTVLTGKYLNGYPDTAPPAYVPPGWTEWYSPSAGNPYSEFNYTLNENGRLVRYGARPEDYLTDVMSAKAADFIRRSAGGGAPFFMYLAPYAPHAPYTPAPRYRDAFAGVQAPRVPSFNETDVGDKPAWVRTRPPLGEQQIAQIDRAYRLRLQSLLAVQDLVDNILRTLQETGQLDNTYIVFTSDNGYHLGQHRLNQGKQAPYEEDIRVPLVIRGPGVPAGAVRDEITGNVDFAPTFAELASVRAADFVDGRSLVPLLRRNEGVDLTWRQGFLLEHDTQGRRSGAPRAVQSQPSPPARAAVRPGGVQEPADAGEEYGAAQRVPAEPDFVGLRTDRYTFVEYDTGERELYDLQNDPYQLVNIVAAADPALVSRLATWLSAYEDCVGAGCRAADRGP